MSEQAGHVTLPHTGLHVPHTGWAVSSRTVHPEDLHTRACDRATLHLHGRPVGTLTSVAAGEWELTTMLCEDDDAFDAYVAHCHMGDGAPLTLDEVAEALVTEYETTAGLPR